MLEEYIDRIREKIVQLGVERVKRCLSDNFIRGVRAATSQRLDASQRLKKLLDSLVDLDADEQEADGDVARGKRCAGWPRRADSSG